MTQIHGTPSIEVTIGRQTRLYHAFITTAPATLDVTKAATPSRLVLIDTTELGWPRRRRLGRARSKEVLRRFQEAQRHDCQYRKRPFGRGSSRARHSLAPPKY